MKINTAVFLVESPMQLLNAIEAKHYFLIQETYLLIRYDGIASNDAHLDYVLNTIDKKFSQVSFFLLRYGKKNIFKMLIPLIWCIRYNPDYLFIGNYYSGYSRLVRMLYPNKRIIYLDDGAQTTKLYYDNKKVNLFSYFSFNEIFSGRIYVHHHFDYLKKKLRDKNQNIAKGTLYFIGTALVENHLIDTPKYEMIIEALINHYKNYRIIYFPHRFEDLTKLSEIKDIEVVKINMPFELFLLQETTLPEIVVSFYSAALYTINSMMGESIKVEAFRIPTNYFINSEYAQKIDNLYDYYSKSMTIIYEDRL